MDINIGQLDFKVGDEVWWFQGSLETYTGHIAPDELDLIHDVVKNIKNGRIYCFHGSHDPKAIWGKSRKEAWKRLKSRVEEWGELE